MRLDFNILWVEDQQANVASQAEKIERVLKKEGFKTHIIFAAHINEAIKLLETEVYGDNVDLILMDYDLGDGKKDGADGLIDVRVKMPYKDIIFYSAQATELQTLVAKRQVQGVDCSIRNDLPDTVERVFEKLIKKVIDIDHSRGIVMGATSEIDHLVNEILLVLLVGCDETDKKKISVDIEKKMVKKRKGFKKADEAISNLEDLRNIGNHYQIFTSFDRILLMKSLLKLKHPTICRKSIGDYHESIMPVRNDLGHIRAMPGEGFKRQFLNRKGEEITVDMMRELRVKLVTHHENFSALHEAHCHPSEDCS